MTTTAPLHGLTLAPTSAHLASVATRQLLRRYVARRVSPADVDDVVQATLCDAIASGRAPGHVEDFRRWLLAIARFKVVDAHRASARSTATSEGDEPATPPPPVEEMSLLRWAERQLPRGTEPTLRWMLREAEGDKLETIAADERLPAERVRQRVSRLRRWMRGQWRAEMARAEMALAEVALLTALALGTAGLLRQRHELILPESGVTSVVSDPALRGSWHLESFVATAPLSSARQTLVDRLSPALTATFDGQTLRLSAADGFERVYGASAAGGHLDAMDASRGTTFTGSYAWAGEELVITIEGGPWAGVARLRPAR